MKEREEPTVPNWLILKTNLPSCKLMMHDAYQRLFHLVLQKDVFISDSALPGVRNIVNYKNTISLFSNLRYVVCLLHVNLMPHKRIIVRLQFLVRAQKEQLILQLMENPTWPP